MVEQFWSHFHKLNRGLEERPRSPPLDLPEPEPEPVPEIQPEPVGGRLPVAVPLASPIVGERLLWEQAKAWSRLLNNPIHQ
jgi:hypothetical protein